MALEYGQPGLLPFTLVACTPRLGEELTSLIIFSYSYIEARMRVKIVVDDVIGALGGLCPHRRRCTCAFEGEPR